MFKIHLKAMYSKCQQYVSILKLNLLSSFIIIISSGLYSKSFNHWSFLLGLASTLVAIAVYWVGYWAVKKEKKKLMIVFFVFLPSGWGYTIWKLYNYTHSDFIDYVELGEFSVAGNCYIYEPSNMLVLFMLVMQILVVIWAVITIRNFNKGLKDYEFIKVKLSKDSSLHLLQEDDIVSPRRPFIN